MSIESPFAFEDRIDSVLRARPTLLPRGAGVLVAVSGGADSTALACVLHRLATRHRWRLELAHFDHGLRPGSATEADRVRELAVRLRLECHVTRAEGLEGSQAEYRDARYQWFESLARAREATRVALAHHADDQRETVLLRLARGTSWTGLAGIPVERGRFVRPLLYESRRSIRDYVSARGVSHVEDPSNRDPRYDRPRVRGSWLPALDACGPASEACDAIAAGAGLVAFARQREVDGLARDVRRDTDEVPGGVQIARSELRTYDPADRRAVLRTLAARFGVGMTRGATLSAESFVQDARSGSKIALGGGLELSRAFDRFRLGRARVRPANLDLEIADPAPGFAFARLGGRGLRIRWGIEPGPASGTVTLRLRTSDFPLRLRAPRPGDRIRLRGGTRKLKDVFVDRRIPVGRRHETPVIEDATGTIRWVAGVAVAAGARPHESAGGQFTIGIDDLGSDHE